MENRLEKLENELEKFDEVNIYMRQDGIGDCFRCRSNFEEIEDEQFHHLRREFIDYANHLEAYVKAKLNHLKKQLDEEYLNSLDDIGTTNNDDNIYDDMPF